MLNIIVICPLTMGIFSEKDIVCKFHHYAYTTGYTYTSLYGYNVNGQYNRLELMEGPSLT